MVSQTRIASFLIKVCIITSLIGYAQNPKTIDSLHSIINSDISLDKKLSAYDELLYQSIISSTEKILPIVDELKMLGSNQSNLHALAKAYYWEGQYFFKQGDFKKAVSSFSISLENANKANDIHTSEKSLTYISSSYYALGEYSKAKQFVNQLININNSTKITNGKVDAYFMLGLINQNQGYNELSVKNYLIADSLNTIQNSKFAYDYKGRIYNNIALLFLDLNNIPKAEYYLKEMEKIYTQHNNEEGIILYKQNFGDLELKRNNYTKALTLLSEAKEYYQKIEFKEKWAETLLSIGEIHFKTKQFNNARDFLNESLSLSKSIDNNHLMAKNYFLLGKVSINLQQREQGKSQLQKALSIYQELNLLDKQIDVLNSLSQFLENNHNFKESLHFLRLKDSVNNVYQKKLSHAKTFQLEAQYQSKKKEEEIQLLTTKNELTLQQKKNQKTLFVSALGVFSLAGLFLFFQFKNKQKINRKLNELNQAKSTFIANVSHEFRTPLTLISGLAQKLNKAPNLSKENKEQVVQINRNSNRILELVNQLLDVSKIKSGTIQLKITSNDAQSFFGTICDGFRFLANQKNMTFTYTNSCNNKLWFDKDILEKALTNLLSNAIKYTPNQGDVSCNINCDDKTLYLSVKNTGEGLTQEEIGKVFNRFYQKNELTQGVGIGLALVKDLINLHKGNISVTSIPNKQTTFTVTIPINKSNYDTHQIITTLQTPQTGHDNNQIEFDDKPILLIVEDNIDVCNYIQSIFNSQYTVLTASNGKEGIDQAIKHIPDIIISDVMMPIKTGIELCETIKNDERTSHIPIILLTAKAGLEYKIEGIKIGADDYITKPFNEEMLQIKVKKLLERLSLLQARFSQEIILKPTDIQVSNTEERFLTKLQDIIDHKLIDSSFSIDEFSSTLGMSRMQLHRKIKALFGLSTSEFIRSQRLKLAADLLTSSSINISEICYSVGFNNPKHFSRIFKEQYGCSPSEFSKKNR